MTVLFSSATTSPEHLPFISSLPLLPHVTVTTVATVVTIIGPSLRRGASPSRQVWGRVGRVAAVGMTAAPTATARGGGGAGVDNASNTLIIPVTASLVVGAERRLVRTTSSALLPPDPDVLPSPLTQLGMTVAKFGIDGGLKFVQTVRLSAVSAIMPKFIHVSANVT